MIIRWRQRQQWYIVTILHRINPHTQATKVMIIIINFDDKILQLLLLPQRLPLVPLPDLFCLCLCNLRGETRLKNIWHAIIMHEFFSLLFIDGDAVLPELAGSEFVSVKLLILGLGFLKLYWYLPPKSSQASSARSITI